MAVTDESDTHEHDSECSPYSMSELAEVKVRHMYVPALKVLRVVRFETDPETGKRVPKDVNDVEFEVQAKGQPTAAVSRKVFKYVQDMVREGGWIEMSAYEVKAKPKISSAEAARQIKEKTAAELSSLQQTVEVKAALMRLSKAGTLSALEDGNIFQGLPSRNSFAYKMGKHGDDVRAYNDIEPEVARIRKNPAFKVGDRVRHRHMRRMGIGTVTRSVNSGFVWVLYAGEREDIEHRAEWLEHVSPLEELAALAKTNPTYLELAVGDRVRHRDGPSSRAIGTIVRKEGNYRAYVVYDGNPQTEFLQYAFDLVGVTPLEDLASASASPKSKKNPERHGFQVGDRVVHKHRMPRLVGTVLEQTGYPSAEVPVQYDGYTLTVIERPGSLERVSPLEDLAGAARKTKKQKNVPWQGQNNPRGAPQVGDRVRHSVLRPTEIGTVTYTFGGYTFVRYDGDRSETEVRTAQLVLASPLEELAALAKKNPSAYTKRTGNQYGLEAALAHEYLALSKEKLQNGAPRYYITFHDVLRIGINPKPGYDTTPVGVYAYPLSGVYPFNLGGIDEAVPYAGKRNYASILEAVDPVHMSILSHASEATMYKNLKRLYRDKTTAFNVALRRAGATSVYDPDLGLIHAHEPEQAVFLVPSAYKVVRTAPVSMYTRALDDADMQIRSGVGKVDESDYYKSRKLAP